MKKRHFPKRFFISLISMSLLFAVAGFWFAANSKSISLDDLKKLSENHALVVAYYDGTVKTYDDNGIKPLFKHLENGNFKDSYVFDKVTGKASSFILVYGGASNLYTGVLSKEAIPVLEKYGVKYSADKIVDYILNVKGDGKCPMEKSVEEIGIDSPQEAYKILQEKFGK
ncbi:MAG: DUF1893 domain-containing protein [Endomicrobium sp.]|nr:DUF1893 domain-containing protein [Endomicrobium sp.]